MMDKRKIKISRPKRRYKVHDPALPRSKYLRAYGVYNLSTKAMLSVHPSECGAFEELDRMERTHPERSRVCGIMVLTRHPADHSPGYHKPQTAFRCPICATKWAVPDENPA